MDAQALIGAQVELGAPDGRVFRFTVQSLVPYAGETYAVLAHEEGENELLVTHVEMGAENAPVFVVVGEDDIISGVMEKLVARTIARSMEDCTDTDDDSDGDFSNADNAAAPSGCNCGCGKRKLPEYIRRP